MGRKLIDLREQAIIRANLDCSPEDIATLIMQETGVVVGPQSIAKYARMLKAEAEAREDAALACINCNIDEFIKSKTNDYLLMLDRNINDLNDIIVNKRTVDKEGNFSIDSYVKASTALGQQIHSMLKIAPKSEHDSAGSKPATTNINVTATLNDIFDAVEKERKRIADPKTVNTDYKLVDEKS